MSLRRMAALLLSIAVLFACVPNAQAIVLPGASIVATSTGAPEIASAATPAPQIASAATSAATSTPKPTATPKPTPIPKATRAKPNSSPAAFDVTRPETLTEKNLYAVSAILMDAATGEVLFSKDADKIMNPASTTKLLTALVAIENANLNDIVVIPSAATKIEETTIKLKEDERITLNDLLHGLLMKSGNDAALAIAMHVSGTVKDFSALMNETAARLGCTSSRFVNPHGLTADGHYVTSRDMALITRAAIQKPELRDILAKVDYTIEATNKTAKREYTSSNALLPESGSPYAYDFSIAGKTGYTSAAQHTYAGVASKDGVELIAVVMGSTKEGKWYDARALFQYGFTRYSPLNVVSLYNASPHVVSVLGADDSNEPDAGKLALRLHNTNDPALLSIMESAANKERIEADFWKYAKVEYISNQLRAPIDEGAPLATLTVSTGNGTVTATLVATRAIAEKVREQTTPSLLSIQNEALQKPVMQSYWWVLVFPAIAFAALISYAVHDTRKKRRRRGNVASPIFTSPARRRTREY